VVDESLGTKIYRYRCPNCSTDFVGQSLLYCPFCGSTLEQSGPLRCGLESYLAIGWGAIAFRSLKSGFKVKFQQDRK